MLTQNIAQITSAYGIMFNSQYSDVLLLVFILFYILTSCVYFNDFLFVSFLGCFYSQRPKISLILFSG